MSVGMVISNHPDLAEEVRQFDVPYFYVPVENGDKKAAEREHLRLLESNDPAARRSGGKHVSYPRA